MNTALVYLTIIGVGSAFFKALLPQELHIIAPQAIAVTGQIHCLIKYLRRSK